MGRLQLGPADQARTLVDAEMALIAEGRAPALARPAGVRVALAARARARTVRGPADLRLDQRGVQQRALLEHQRLRLQLTVELVEQRPGQAAPHQLQAEAADRRAVRRVRVQTEPDEAAE